MCGANNIPCPPHLLHSVPTESIPTAKPYREIPQPRLVRRIRASLDQFSTIADPLTEGVEDERTACTDGQARPVGQGLATGRDQRAGVYGRAAGIWIRLPASLLFRPVGNLPTFVIAFFRSRQGPMSLLLVEAWFFLMMSVASKLNVPSLKT